ncbi:MBL fold metallo-hydrolase [Paratissierella segnis]|jgi:L-ascorbate metabolism protein UlaG (beta-lactamase superfamily)|uniref:MBL fold metallo-hydrolase n=1 Tax=Paratissierella segnis TaxID=2763679 RepID=A0A926IJZ0_9FIRM|nr:MBL fold metallo-hydrolase [Paratissierella segnis]MBC8587158.1 MBL fold metallo-hydrolase [Paratissierella segnis]
MKVEYIYHSGFTIEADDYFLVFDYYRGDITLKDKKIIVFSTHKHHDHYNPKILTWKKNYPDISYVLSSDIDVSPSKNIYKIDPYEELKLQDVAIKAFGSTDLGVSLLIKLEDKNIFFAGDLNWWHWEEDFPEDQLKEEKDFKDEVSKIIGERIDVAFFPVDPRLEDAFYLGAQYFIEKLKPKIFFPMHFGDKYEIIPKLINKINDNTVDIVKIKKKNQVFIV